MRYQDAVSSCANLITMIKEVNPTHPDPWQAAFGVINESEAQFGVSPQQMVRDIEYVLESVN